MKNTVNSKVGTPTPLTAKNNYGKIHTMKHETIFNTLQSGICEITYKDVHSVENSFMATLAPNHLPHDCDTIDVSPDDTTVVVCFNVNTEKWENVLVDSVIDIEQLTGEGAPNNEKKLQAGPEYMEQLDLFTQQGGTSSSDAHANGGRNNNDDDDCIIDDGDYDPSEDDVFSDDDEFLWDLEDDDDIGE